MDNIKFFFKNLKTNIKRFFFNLYKRSYGLDELNKNIIIVSFGLSIINIIFKNAVISGLSTVFLVLFVFRYFSSNKVVRAKENRVYKHFIKYLKSKWETRKTHRIYMCKNCKQIIRLPKGYGKVECTCPNCGYKQTRRT